MNQTLKRVTTLTTGLLLFAAVSLKATPVIVTELGVGPNEIVQIDSSTLGSGLSVYACVVNLQVDSLVTRGFCIDPYHWSVGGPQVYEEVSLADAPKPPGPMGAVAAKEIEQLWAHYYTNFPNISNETAAGLQIAIWEIVNGAIGSTTFHLDSSNDYGAATMLAWVTNSANANAPRANLIAVSSVDRYHGQDYVIPGVPDGGSTAALLGAALMGLYALRRRR